MAKTTVTKRTLDIVDLIRDRKLFPLLNVPPMRVQVTIEVTTSALLTTPPPVPEAKMKRLEAAARTKLEEYETIITKECARFNQKIDDLLNQGNLKEATAVADQVNHAVKNALLSAEGAASKAVEEAKKKESQGDKLLLEARIKTGVKVVFVGVSLTTHAVKLAGSHGTDVTAYIGIAKGLVTLGMELNQQFKGEKKLRQDLVDGIKAYIDLRGTVIMQAAKRQGLTDTSSLPGFPQVIMFVAEGVVKAGKEVSKGRDKATIAKDVADFVVKGIMAEFNDTKKAREMYRNHTVKMRQGVDRVSVQADKLMAEMKKATNLKDGVKIGAQCMQLKGKVTRLAKALDDAQGFLTAAEITMQQFGLKCDDRTIVEKIKALDVSTIFSEGTGLVENISSIYSLFEAVASAVG
jgi:hypothetical protein